MICLWRLFYYKDFSFSVCLGGLTCFLKVQGISFFLFFFFFQGISEHPIGDSLQCWFTNRTGKDNNILALDCPLFFFFHCLWLFSSWIALRIKNPTCNDCRRHGGCEFDSWVRKIPSTPVFSPKKSHEQRSLVGCSPWVCKESDTTKQWSIHALWLFILSHAQTNWSLWILKEIPTWSCLEAKSKWNRKCT